MYNIYYNKNNLKNASFISINCKTFVSLKQIIWMIVKGNNLFLLDFNLADLLFYSTET